MLSKNKLKFIHALELKKNRSEEKLFIAEGDKLTEELLEVFPCRMLCALPVWIERHSHIPAQEIIEVSQEELNKASLLKTPQEVLGVFEQPQYVVLPHIPQTSLCLALDDIQDPGNLGTIVRIADWFGIEHIYCSLKTADIYNPKAVQATMGAIARVQLHYIDLVEFFNSLTDVPVFGTFLNGDSIYNHPLSTHGIIVIGNEGNGICNEVSQCVSERIHIPSFPTLRKTSESLNAAIATAITCAEFRRRQ